VADRVERRAQRVRRIGVECVLLALDRPIGAGERPAGVALGDDALHADRAPSRQEVIGALRAQAVGQREAAIDVAEVDPLERGELVDDHLGLGLGDRMRDRVGVERVGHDGPGAEHAQQVLLGRGLGHADDLVTAGHELGDEPLAEGARGAGDEDLHGGLLSRHCTQQTRWPTGL
jgi:hypothetical protein